MIAVQELYDFVTLVANKEQRGSSSLGPDEFNTLMRRAVSDLFNIHYGRIERQRHGGAMAYEDKPAQEAQSNQYSIDILSSFKRTDKVTASLGLVNKPTGYFHLLAMRHIFQHDGEIQVVEVDSVREHQLASKLSDPISSPDLFYPIYVQNKDTFKIYPEDVQIIEMDYYGVGPQPNMVYNVVNDEVQIDPTLTVDIDLPENYLEKVAHYILVYIGINLRENQLLGYAQQIKEQG